VGTDESVKPTYVIVAIPTDHSDIWKLSSEPTPHLTILFLGENLEKPGAVMRYVEHVASTTGCFYAGVDRRGVLGDKSADVLFLHEKHPVLDDLHHQLLSNDDVARAYLSAEQYPRWIPHVTLGYPETPAKNNEGGNDMPYAIKFDRLALWTGENEGVEFPLKKDVLDSDLSMSEAHENFLKHYGIRGMKWGVTRNRDTASGSSAGAKKSTAKPAAKKTAPPAAKKPSKLATAAKKGAAKTQEAFKPSQDAISAKKLMARAKLGGVQNLNNREMQHVIARMNLERQYKELYGERQWTNKGLKWAGKFLEDIGKDVITSWLRNPFAKRSGGTGPVHAQAWTNGQNFAGAIDNPRKAIGR
jgi:hypothetical protein